MAKYLSSEWMDAARDAAQALPIRPGASCKVGYQITGAPDGGVRYFVVIADGRVIEQALGERADLDVVLVMSHVDALRMQRGEIDQNVAFMQGKIKVAAGGDMAKLMALLPLTKSAEFKATQAAINQLTEY